MNDFRKVDEHGFVIPPSFGEVHSPEDLPPTRKPISLRTKRLVIFGVLFGIVIPVVFGPKILSFARESLSQWLLARAERKIFADDYSGAISDLNWSLDWNPNAWYSYMLRGEVRLELNDLEGSLTDYNKLIDLLSSQDEVRRRRRPLDRNSVLAEAYSSRSWVLTRLGRGREAIDDASHAVKLVPSPLHLNSRAYVRAQVNLELKEGLDDIDKALAQTNNDKANLLDTRGYLLHLLNRNEEALTMLDDAIKVMEHYNRALVFQHDPFDPRSVGARRREIDHALAVMYHHRGLVNEKLGNKEAASQDFALGEKHGYDPAKGVL
ncbi:MAG TPA: tetratricopeptide repeat protein [Pirellulales bacterium]